MQQLQQLCAQIIMHIPAYPQSFLFGSFGMGNPGLGDQLMQRQYKAGNMDVLSIEDAATLLGVLQLPGALLQGSWNDQGLPFVRDADVCIDCSKRFYGKGLEYRS
ncbi:hypothetical protein, partial [Alcanivorax sp. HI0083]|uniref:hypothetical protein n=1 Tax=Alcanivorax sp. HI0083 TaxID=1822258 RepID=UPI001E35BEE7